VLNNKKTKKRYILTEEKLDKIGAHLEGSPKKSLRQLALQCKVSKSAAHIATELLKLKPYRTTVVHQLLLPEAEARINYCRWFQQLVCDGMVDADLMFYTDKVWFHLSGYVNSQNSHYWSVENPHSIQDVKIGVWCAISVYRIIRSVFF
jgi:hypothetical protein